MSNQSRQPSTAAKRRARERAILQATRSIFDEAGVSEAQIDDIAKMVGVNRAIIYRHFSGKEELFALTLVSYLDELAETLAGAAASPQAPADKLANLVVEFTEYGIQHPAFVDCALALMRRSGSELFDEISETAMFRLGRAMSNCLKQVSGVIDEGIELGDFHNVDSTTVANHMYATGLGALQLARVGMVVGEAAPGVPKISSLGTEEVKGFLVASARALVNVA
ncbi:MAG TPA: TetR/AcrR family transcriptional regulator [Marmoricola sp.]|nr:TetR/AcrR family transcriptional regulator [Marmoricola sp.]HMY08311.1 TetR/AcrR family transcriptional regulator [Marmoricola sp.]HRV69553.1 TetR/AcrR family transcriptional regulator [Marmoricola sp.]